MNKAALETKLSKAEALVSALKAKVSQLEKQLEAEKAFSAERIAGAKAELKALIATAVPLEEHKAKVEVLRDQVEWYRKHSGLKNRGIQV